MKELQSPCMCAFLKVLNLLWPTVTTLIKYRIMRRFIKIQFTRYIVEISNGEPISQCGPPVCPISIFRCRAASPMRSRVCELRSRVAMLITGRQTDRGRKLIWAFVYIHTWCMRGAKKSLMRGSRKFFQRESNCFFSWLGERGSNYHYMYKRAIICSPAKRHLAFRWCADGGPTLNAGLVALWIFRGSGPVLLRNPIFLWFQGGPDPLPPLPAGSAHKSDESARMLVC